MTRAKELRSDRRSTPTNEKYRGRNTVRPLYLPLCANHLSEAVYESQSFLLYLDRKALNRRAVSNVKPNWPRTSFSSISDVRFAKVSDIGRSIPSAIGILTLPCNL